MLCIGCIGVWTPKPQFGSTHRIVLYPASMWCQDGQIVTGTWTLTVRVPKLGIWIPLEIYFLEENGDSQLILRHIYACWKHGGVSFDTSYLKDIGLWGWNAVSWRIPKSGALRNCFSQFLWVIQKRCMGFWRIHYWILGIFFKQSALFSSKGKMEIQHFLR